MTRKERLTKRLLQLQARAKKLDTLCASHKADIVITVSGDAELAPESVKKYFA